MGLRGDRIQIKSADQLAVMRAAGLVVARTLDALRQSVRPGITTAQLDEQARDLIATAGATPSFLGYHGFPAVICTSVNDEIVHGIPGDRVLAEGDLISIDCGAIVDGWHGDAAISVPVGQIAPAVEQLSAVTEASLWAGLKAATVGAHLTDISHAVEKSITAAARSLSGEPYGIVADYGGHGIGDSMHMDPHILNFGSPGRGPKLKAGMALAIEPMVTLGDATTRTLEDDWTVVSRYGGWASHWEHTVAVTDEGPWVLTALDDVRLD